MSQWVTAAPPQDCALGDSNIYFGIHPCNAARGRYERSRIEDVAWINCLFSEFDAKDHNNDLAQVREHVKAIEPQPQVVIYSGGGIHAYWLIREPMVHNSSTSEYLRGTQSAWVRYTGGDSGAKDLARVLRLPGTLNAKYDPPRRVTFARFNYTGLAYELYDLNDLCSIADDYWLDDAPATEIQPPTNGERRGRIAAAVKVLYEAPEGERNTKLHWAACRMYEMGMSEAGAAAELLPTALHIGLKEKEAISTIHSASKQPVRETQAPVNRRPARPTSLADALGRK